MIKRISKFLYVEKMFVVTFFILYSCAEENSLLNNEPCIEYPILSIQAREPADYYYVNNPYGAVKTSGTIRYEHNSKFDIIVIYESGDTLEYSSILNFDGQHFNDIPIKRHESVKTYIIDEEGCKSIEYIFTPKELFTQSALRSNLLISKKWKLVQTENEQGIYEGIDWGDLELFFLGELGKGTLQVKSNQVMNPSVNDMWPIIRRWKFNQAYDTLLLSDSIHLGLIKLNSDELQLTVNYPENSPVPVGERCDGCNFTFEPLEITENETDEWLRRVEGYLAGDWYLSKVIRPEPQNIRSSTYSLTGSDKCEDVGLLTLQINQGEKNGFNYCTNEVIRIERDGYFNRIVMPREGDWEVLDYPRLGGWTIKRYSVDYNVTREDLLYIEKLTEDYFRYKIQYSYEDSDRDKTFVDSWEFVYTRN